MPLMGSLYIGQSGLQTSQNALNTTAHNLSNIETTGYVRQQVLMADKDYINHGVSAISYQQTGLGVDYDKVRQVRDFFLDTSYRKESGRSAFYDVCYEASVELETLLGEFSGAEFQDTLANFWTAIQELQKDPASAVTQGQLISVASQFLESAQNVYQGMADYQDNLNSRIGDMITQINDYGNQLCKLNREILKVESGSEEANDLRDQRNYILDQLGSMMNMTYAENSDGTVDVYLEGSLFVVRGSGKPFEMGMIQDPNTGFYTPTWPMDENSPVFNLNQDISTVNNTNIGQLKSIVLARGDRRANYTDLSDSYKDPKTGESVDLYNRGASDKMATANSVVMNGMAEFDRLINKMVTEINNILTGEKSTIDAGGTPSYASEDDVPKELFVRLGTGRYSESGGVYSYIAEDTSGSPVDVSTMYTLSNLKINPELAKEPTLIGYPMSGFVSDDGSVDQTKADELAAAFAEAGLILNPNVTKSSNFTDYYADLVNQMANAGFIYKSISESQSATVDAIEEARQAVMGVSSNEELSNMIKFQSAYNASSRYINVINEMLGTIIESLG